MLPPTAQGVSFFSFSTVREQFKLNAVDNSSRTNRSASLLGLTAAALLLGVGGCSLVSLKSPERPLSARDSNARLLTREYSAHFIEAIEKGAGDITAAETDTEVLTNTLRWEVGASTQSVRAAMQLAPMMSFLDTWALALQMREFFAEGNAGGSLFGSHQEAVRALADLQAVSADNLARRIIAPKEFRKYQTFVQDYVLRYPIQDLQFAREPIVDLWSRETGSEVKLVDSLGTIPEAMSDFADRLQIYSDTLPSQTLWKTQLALRDSGYSRLDLSKELSELDRRFERMAAVAENAPALVHDSVRDVRQTLLTIIDKLNQSSQAMILALHDERVALTADVRSERATALVAVDEQRKALAIDAAKLSNQLLTTAGQELRRLAREVILLLVLFSLVVLGLPFAAGYLVGRGRR
jgi:hypothetical protein